MIAALRGKILSLGPSKVYLECSGVVYELHVPLNVMSKLESQNSVLQGESQVMLFTHHYFGQEEQKLFGFLEAKDKQLFSVLLDIKGLGPSLALSLLSHVDGPTLLLLAERNDLETLKKVPRIGKNTAETILFEVGRKRKKFEEIIDRSEITLASNEERLALEALSQLGYTEKQIQTAFTLLKQKGIPSGVSDWIKESLRVL